MVVDGLFISVVGMTMVFAVLVIIMFVMMLIQRLFHEAEAVGEYGAAAAGEPETALVGAATEAAADPAVAARQAPALGGVLSTIGVEMQAEPTCSAEVAAIVLALAAHLGKGGDEAERWHMTIGALEYEVEVSTPWHSPVAIVVNGERCWGSLDGTGLPVQTTLPTIRPRSSTTPSGRGWRSAQPIGQAGHWDRRGWNKRR